MKLIASLPPQGGLIRLQPSRQKFPSRFGCGHLLRVLARVDGDFPAPVVFGADDISAGPLRFAILHADFGQFGHAFVVHFDIDHQPWFVKA